MAHLLADPMNISRRVGERIPLYSSSFQAIWLSDWQKMDETGVLTNISTGGFGGCMVQAPASGHLIHARLTLETPPGKDAPVPIELDARICGRAPSGNGKIWVVHCAIESIHPADEKHMMQMIQMHESGNLYG